VGNAGDGLFGEIFHVQGNRRGWASRSTLTENFQTLILLAQPAEVKLRNNAFVSAKTSLQHLVLFHVSLAYMDVDTTTTVYSCVSDNSIINQFQNAETVNLRQIDR